MQKLALLAMFSAGSAALALGSARADEPTPPTPPANAAPPAPAPKVDDLQREYEKIREGLFTARARAAAVSAAMYSSKLQVYLRYGTPRFFHVSRASIRLDGAPVFDDSNGAIASDDLLRFDGYIAPGKHLLDIRVDAEAKDDTSFASQTQSTFTIDVPEHKVVVLRAQAEDGGDMGSTWTKKKKGGYRLHLDADVQAVDVPAAPGGPAPAPAPKADAPKK
jgi:hypothetical protein